MTGIVYTLAMSENKRKPKPRTAQFSFRTDEELLDNARAAAQEHGDLAAVIRVLLRAFVKDPEGTIDWSAKQEETTQAKENKRGPKPKKKKKSAGD